MAVPGADGRVTEADWQYLRTAKAGLRWAGEDKLCAVERFALDLEDARSALAAMRERAEKAEAERDEAQALVVSEQGRLRGYLATVNTSLANANRRARLDVAFWQSSARGEHKWRAQVQDALTTANARIAELEDALRKVRSAGFLAGAATVLRNDDWQARTTEVLDIVDDALAAAKEPT